MYTKIANITFSKKFHIFIVLNCSYKQFSKKKNHLKISYCMGDTQCYTLYTYYIMCCINKYKNKNISIHICNWFMNILLNKNYLLCVIDEVPVSNVKVYYNFAK